MTIRQLNRTQRLAVRILAGALALAMLACLAGAGLIVTRGMANPASLAPIYLKAANRQLWIGVTDNPACAPMMPGCIHVPPPNRQYLSVWLATTKHSYGRMSIEYQPLVRWRFR